MEGLKTPTTSFKNQLFGFMVALKKYKFGHIC
jgi:hypothetical protein